MWLSCQAIIWISVLAGFCKSGLILAIAGPESNYASIIFSITETGKHKALYASIIGKLFGIIWKAFC